MSARLEFEMLWTEQNVFIDDLSVTIQLNNPSSFKYQTVSAHTHPRLTCIISTQYYITGAQDDRWPPLFTDQSHLTHFQFQPSVKTFQQAVSSSESTPESVRGHYLQTLSPEYSQTTTPNIFHHYKTLYIPPHRRRLHNPTLNLLPLQTLTTS